jgi:hypothetical protein
MAKQALLKLMQEEMEMGLKGGLYALAGAHGC